MDTTSSRGRFQVTRATIIYKLYRNLSPLDETVIDRLSSTQRSHLRSLAHDLDPVVHVGKEGVTEPVLQSTENAFNTRELLKVKVLDGSPQDTGATGRELADRLENVYVVQVIGHVVVLYRPDPDSPQIQLPS